MDFDRRSDVDMGRMKYTENEKQANRSITNELHKPDHEQGRSADVADAGGKLVASPGESRRKIDHDAPVQRSSYNELYEEQLIANNMRCYMQWFRYAAALR